LTFEFIDLFEEVYDDDDDGGGGDGEDDGTGIYTVVYKNVSNGRQRFDSL